jgi:hypothetical protein
MAMLQPGYVLWVKTYADGESQSVSFHTTIDEARDAATRYFASRAELQITRTGEGACHTWMFDYDTRAWGAKSRRISALS